MTECFLPNYKWSLMWNHTKYFLKVRILCLPLDIRNSDVLSLGKNIKIWWCGIIGMFWQNIPIHHFEKYWHLQFLCLNLVFHNLEKNILANGNPEFMAIVSMIDLTNMYPPVYKWQAVHIRHISWNYVIFYRYLLLTFRSILYMYARQ